MLSTGAAPDAIQTARRRTEINERLQVDQGQRGRQEKGQDEKANIRQPENAGMEWWRGGREKV
jgi:hypothetical protein